MPTYAVLGSTGNIGRSIIQNLLKSPDKQIHAYWSRAKLEQLFPGISEDNHVTIFEGAIDDTELLSACLSGTRAAFLAVALTSNAPGITVAMDTACAVVSALGILRDRQESIPKLVVLSSASTEHRLLPSTPTILLNILYRAFSYIYDDLKRAEEYLRAQDGITATWIKPSAIANDEQKGHVLSLDIALAPVTFLDVAAGMIGVADEKSGGYAGKSSRSTQLRMMWRFRGMRHS